MGDPTRFRKFAALVQWHFPARGWKVADVASGRGGLRAELYRVGYKNVESWDRRRQNAKGRPGYRYGHFDWRQGGDYQLLVGMHPDGATDQVVRAAAYWRVPFILCPCCVMPTALEFSGSGYDEWVDHLAAFARSEGIIVIETTLPMTGANRVLMGHSFQ